MQGVTTAQSKEATGWDCKYHGIGNLMESATGSRSVSLAWKLSIIVPLAVAVAVLTISARQTDQHTQIMLSIVANIFGVVALIAQAAFWIVVRKWTGLGIVMLIFTSAVLGFGLHSLLRVLSK
jgi:hypothetical protein